MGNFLESYINGTMQCVSLCVCFLSLSTVILRFIHAVACIQFNLEFWISSTWSWHTILLCMLNYICYNFVWIFVSVCRRNICSFLPSSPFSFPSSLPPFRPAFLSSLLFLGVIFLVLVSRWYLSHISWEIFSFSIFWKSLCIMRIISSLNIW